MLLNRTTVHGDKLLRTPYMQKIKLSFLNLQITLTIFLCIGFEFILTGYPAKHLNRISHKTWNLAFHKSIIAQNHIFFPNVRFVGLNNNWKKLQLSYSQKFVCEVS